MSQTLAAVIHGESGSGKSYFGGSAPGPRLILDAEGGSRFIKNNKRKIMWDPLTEKPPVNDGSWDACFVQVLNWKTLHAAYQWLASGQHEFKSVVIDSKRRTGTKKKFSRIISNTYAASATARARSGIFGVKFISYDFSAIRTHDYTHILKIKDITVLYFSLFEQ